MSQFQRKTAFQVFSSVNQTIASGGSSTVAFNTESLDQGNNFDLATERYTVPLNGLYRFDATLLCQFTAANTSRCLLVLETSAGGGLWRESDMSYTGHAINFVFTQALHATLLLTTGTVVQLKSQSVSGSGYTIIGGADLFVWSGYRVESESKTILDAG